MEPKSQPKALDMRDAALWEGVSPVQMWARYRQDLHRQLLTVFDPKRLRPVVRVREEEMAVDTKVGI